MEENKTEEKEEFQIWFGKIGICLPKDQDSIDIARTLLDVLEENLNGTSPIQGQKECSCTRCETDRHERRVPEGHQTQAYPVISPAGKEGLLSLIEQGVWQIQEVPRFETGATPIIVEKLEVYPSGDMQRLKFKRISSASSVRVLLADMSTLASKNETLRITAISHFNTGKKDVLRYALRLWDKIQDALFGQSQTPQTNSLPTEDIKNSPEQEGIPAETTDTPKVPQEKKMSEKTKSLRKTILHLDP